MLFLLCIGLLLHESVYLSSRGSCHFKDDIAPVLGLHLHPYGRIGLHILFVSASITFLLNPENSYAGLLLLLLLSIIIASFPKRLPNHLIVAWFFLLVVLLDHLKFPYQKMESVHGLSPAGLGIIQLLTALTYLFAAFHKLNRSFFDPQISCGSGLLIHYLLQRGIGLSRQPKWTIVAGIHSVIILEIICPFLLINGPTTQYGVLLLSLLAMSFGYLGHVHFSVIMLSGIYSFLEVPNHIFQPSIILAFYLPISALLAFIGGNTYAYKYRFLAFLNYIILSLITVTVIQQMITIGATNEAFIFSFSNNPVFFLCFFIAYSFNALSPYLGLKLGFSLAMFSNLRPDKWDHLIIHNPLQFGVPRYLTNITLACPAEYYGKASQIFNKLCPSADRDSYSIGYVTEVVRNVKQQLGEEIVITISGRETKSGYSLKIGSKSTKVLRWYECLSVYPFRIPKRDEPLCT